jgi:ATP-dependent helicase/nuclease subunit A
MQGFHIYKSSAGSGKTFTLVKEYLKLALQNPAEFKQILAITFTNKATAEMKNRIIKALVELIENKNPGLESILKSEMPAGIDIQKNAGLVLDRILHDYSNFSISTIDSFFHKIIRAFSKEMQLPLRFDVEMNQSNVIVAITDNLLQDIGKNKELSVWLEKLMLFKLAEDKGWKIENDIQFIARELFKENFHAMPAAPMEVTETFIEQLFETKRSFEKKMQEYGEEALGIIKKHHLHINDFAHKSGGVANYFQKICYRNNPENYIPGKRSLEALENPDKWYSKTSENKELINQLVTEGIGADKPLIYILSDIVEYYTNESTLYNSCTEVLKLAYIFGIVSHLQEKLKEYRDEKNLVMMADTTHLLRQFISDSDTPFVFEKMGNAFKHFLIDEFQDTSDFQWHNLLPLLENAIGSNNFAMVVGDAKQSIYRWRGGNMQLLLSGVQQDLGHFKDLIHEEKLNTNFRSKKHIIEFNNSFFEKAAACIKLQIEADGHNLLDKAYLASEVHQKIAPKNNEGGYVQINLIEADDWKAKALSQMLLTIKELEKDHFALKDIAILVRKNTEGNAIAQFLFENGYTKVISSESLLLWNSPKIQFIINVLHYLNNRQNHIAKTNLLYFYARFKDWSHQNDHLFTDFNKPNNQLFETALPAEFTSQLNHLSKLPLYELSEQVVSIFELNKDPDAYIQRFQDLMLEYASKQRTDLRSFIDWWEKNKNSDKCSVIVPENENAIRILSVHKSKGLQFPVVIMPFTDWKLAPDARDVLWVSSDMPPFAPQQMVPVKPGKSLNNTLFKAAYTKELVQTYVDNINVLYVAFTRAEQRMYSFGPLPVNEKLSSIADLIHQTLGPNNFSEQGVYEVGACQEQVQGKEEQTEEIVKLSQYPSTRWQSKLAISTKAANLWDIVDNEKNENVNYGILVHDVLANVRVASDADKSITRLCHAGLINALEKAELKLKVSKVLALPQVASWFAEHWEVKNERELLLPDGQTMRPDRVIVHNNKALVIDYKTGAREKRHEEQVCRYAEVLEAMGYSPVEKYLLYINELHILKVENP